LVSIESPCTTSY